MKKILILTDFSAASRKAAQYARTLFDDVAAEFILLNVYPVEPDTMYGTGFATEAARQSAEAGLAQFLAEMVDRPTPDFHTYRPIACPGGVVGAVAGMMAREPFDFVVVGASGQGGSEWFGSTATGLIRSIRANILIVPAGAAIAPLRRVVLATDYRSIHRLESLRPLKDWLTLKNAHLTLLTILPGPETPENYDEAARRLTDFMETDDVDIQVMHHDDTDRGIDQYLAAHPTDLLVTVPHQKGLFDLLMGRSVTRKLALRPRVPMLSVFDPEAPQAPVTHQEHYMGYVL